MMLPRYGIRACGAPLDNNLVEVCRAEGRALITLDLGFADIRAYPPAQFAGMIVLRLANQSRDPIIRAMTRLLPLLSDNRVAGRLWIVDEQTARVRGKYEL